MKDAGIEWHPSLHDFFAIPDVGLDQKVFIVNDMMAEVEVMGGRRAITFHGVVEWALDYVLPMDAVWLPQEAQLRNLLLGALGPAAVTRLICTTDGYRCEIQNGVIDAGFDADSAGDAYGLALLACLNGSLDDGNGPRSGPHLNGR